MIATPIRDLVIDVGANQGGFALEVAARNPGVLVLALEPIPELCAGIAAKVEAQALPNVTLLPLAADQEARTAKFHVSAHDDCGVSSLLGFDQQRIGDDEYWRNRQDLYFDRSIEVSVVRLDSISEIQRAERIRFIKIDAQGVDLAVLESLGDNLARVEAGMLEVPSTLEGRLYEGESHDVRSVLVRLHELGFRLYALKPNDHAAKEFNVFFCRQDVDWRDVERELQLRGIHLYDGKHFWHAPGNRLAPDAELADMQRIIDRLQLVERALTKETAETRRLNDALAVRERVSALKGIAPTGDRTELVPSRFDLKALVTSGARVLWVGGLPPLARFEADPRLLNPAADYRMPAAAHQAYDLVYLVEQDLGQLKAWPLIVDEALRLLAPGGVLVVRFTNTILCSVFALKHFIRQWGDLQPVFEFTGEDGATEFGVRNCRTTRRPASSSGFSIGVITDGKRMERLDAFIASVRELDRAEGQEVELLVCGPDSIRAAVEAAYPGASFIADPGEFAEQGWITRKKNLIADRARHENLVVVHDRYTLQRDFLRGMAQFGGDYGVAICRQLRPDGRRYPDWVATGAQWTWSSPGVLAYGDWSPHVYINGGITIGKTAILREVRWNELLFWNQAEDVELTRRLVARGHLPRFIRQAEVVSHVTRAGTMEAFAPLPELADRYHLPAPAQVSAEVTAPALAFGQTLRFLPALRAKLARLGLFYCEQWQVRADGWEISAGLWGELGGRLPVVPSTPLLITFGLSAPAGTTEAIVNDLPVAVHAVGTMSLRLVVPSTAFAGTQVLRIHVRVKSGSLRLRTLHMTPQGWLEGQPLPATREALQALVQRPVPSACVDGATLCVSDLALLLRGTRRVALVVPDATGARAELLPLVEALRNHLRSDAQLRLVGRAWPEAEGVEFLAIDWDQLARDQKYFAEREAAFAAFAPEIIVNARTPRDFMADALVARCPALARVGFEGANDDASQEAFAAKYSTLLSDTATPARALSQVLGLPAPCAV